MVYRDTSGGRRRHRLLLSGLAAALLALSGCLREEAPPPASSPAASPPASSSLSAAPPSAPPQGGESAEAEDLPWERAEGAAAHPYLQALVREAVGKFTSPEMGEAQRAKAAFDYLIGSTVFAEPVGLELWRIHGGGESPIPYLEQRALSPLRYGVGSCEDYAAALVLLLREMGLEARYVPGLTYSVEGHLVDHAWTVAKIQGEWYHLDSQLEDNISRNGLVRYRYFMKGDPAMSASHLWGRDLAASGLLPQAQREALEAEYLIPACPRSYPTPQPLQLEEKKGPGPEELRAQAQEELAAYQSLHGPLPPMELNTVPPVFGLEGFGPPDEG